MNEIWFIALTFLDLLFVLLAWRFGKEWVVTAIVINVILTTTFAAKLISIFGLTTSASSVFYSAIFIGTDILTEHHGKEEGYRSIWMGFMGLLTFVLFGQVIILFSSVQDTVAISDAMETLFGAVPRIAAASFTAYLIAQRFDIWLYHSIHKKTGQRYLWLRNCGSTFASQLLDSIIFFGLAFLGTIPINVLLKIIFTAYTTKIIVGLLDTPFIYLSYAIKGLKPPDINV